MKRIDIASIAQFASGRLRSGDAGRLVTRVNTDSRSIQPGDVFIALVGERFDAHDFIPQVAAAGAAACIVSHFDEAWRELSCAFIEVPDTLVGLQSLAKNYREWHCPIVIGITGSNGKTSAKDMTCAIMASAHQVCATIGNLNNHIGLPLSILGLSAGDTCGVFEMGMNHPGEIAPLAAIAQPDVAIITSVGIAHIEFMGSREAIALEKGMLAEAVPASGHIILNANDDFTDSIASRCKGKVTRAGIGKGEVGAHNLVASTEGTAFDIDFNGTRLAAFVPVPGEHMVGNATLAAAAAWRLGVEPTAIVAALRDAKLTKGRLQQKVINGIIFLDDSYNANPDSMKAGLRTLAGLNSKGAKVAVLGKMGELGEHAERGHREVGEYAASLGLDIICSVGDDESKLITDAATQASIALKSGLVTIHYPSHEKAAEHLRAVLGEGDLVLVKGSRSAGMEKVMTLFAAA
jgi:UDP-N-acetylmuramoyl-tripeptide--D-alanyl-D-alanine ligase